MDQENSGSCVLNLETQFCSREVSINRAIQRHRYTDLYKREVHVCLLAVNRDKNRVDVPIDTSRFSQEISWSILSYFRPPHILCSMINEDLPYHLPYTTDWHH